MPLEVCSQSPSLFQFLPAILQQHEDLQRRNGCQVGGANHSGPGHTHNGLNHTLTQQCLHQAGAGEHPRQTDTSVWMAQQPYMGSMYISHHRLVFLPYFLDFQLPQSHTQQPHRVRHRKHTDHRLGKNNNDVIEGCVKVRLQHV